MYGNEMLPGLTVNKIQAILKHTHRKNALDYNYIRERNVWLGLTINQKVLFCQLYYLGNYGLFVNYVFFNRQNNYQGLYGGKKNFGQSVIEIRNSKQALFKKDDQGILNEGNAWLGCVLNRRKI